MPAPKSSDVLRALRRHAGVRTHSMRRFPTGLAHYVYEVMTDGDPLVVRMADPGYHNGIPGGVYWHRRLKPLGVPLPELLGYDLEAPFPYMILERLRGADLGAAYSGMDARQKQRLAREIAAIQDRVGGLPAGPGYGYLESYETRRYARSWWDVLDGGLAAAREHITAAGLFDPGLVDRARSAALDFEGYIQQVPPLPFLDDTTTKNVIVHEGALQGIVDVDALCFGDRLYVLGLTQMALLGDGQDTQYVEDWAAAWELDAYQRLVVRLYSALHCVYFMGELGTAFNKERPEPVDEARAARYLQVFEGLLEALD